MGGVQSGAHNLGDALWVQERQRQKWRGSGRYEERSSSQERRKLLKRTRSLAVVSEDIFRNHSDSRRFRLGEPSDTPRRSQLIPRAKLIDRNSLKDRLSKSQQHLSDSYERLNETRSCHSRSICGLHPISTTISGNFEPSYSRSNDRPDSDRLNILEWPDPPRRRFTTVQDFDSVTGLVDIVEDNWPIEENRSLDCVYTQVKRKRKEHRSLDSILFEDEDELEYFDVLNLLPLSNVRLEFSDQDETRSRVLRSGRTNPISSGEDTDENAPRVLDLSPSGENVTDEEKSRIQDSVEETRGKQRRNPSSCRVQGNHHPKNRTPDQESLASIRGDQNSPEKSSKSRRLTLEEDEEEGPEAGSEVGAEESRTDVEVIREVLEKREVEEAEDFKSIWISDSEEVEEMSRRPQVLKIVDNDVTRRSGRASQLVEVQVLDDEVECKGPEVKATEKDDEASRTHPKERSCQDEQDSSLQSEGKLGRIIKETSSILGKACSAVKGTLGFEAKSEGSGEDDGVDVGPSTRTKRTSNRDQDGPEFDHVRYKIVKSDVFGRNIYGTSKGDVSFDGLIQYLRKYSFQDLLVDNNVVIIEPVRAETIERKSSAEGKIKSPASCKVAGALQKRTKPEEDEDSSRSRSLEGSKESSLRRHFFYHPIRVNRELIDEELPDPDTVRNVRRMFESTLQLKRPDDEFSRSCRTRRSVSMKDLRRIKDQLQEKEPLEVSRTKDLGGTREAEKSSLQGAKEEPESPRSESKTRILARSFEARSGHTSPSDSTTLKSSDKSKYHNWDAGSVSSGVSSDYPDTDPGSGARCTSSDEDLDCREDDELDTVSGHFVSQDVLKKIRECGTSVTYYGGKVVHICNGPLISPARGKPIKDVLGRREAQNGKDFVKLRLVKSNSCDSRLELTGRLVDRSRKTGNDATEISQVSGTNGDRRQDLRKWPILENEDKSWDQEGKREPPVVVGLAPKRDERKEQEVFRADFNLCRIDDLANGVGKFGNSALTRWQVNENATRCDFGKMEFEEFEVLEDSLNGNER
ncbi:uncharacterized protein LOC105696915 [Orussus abietinus]|uniref:uncharacterized protein LOC105696915 n=1 Tax=Orussus abietinus TaxID=222816 RepID=UPI00062506AF|nr:uncharacterized protein LOC105696915 [Orussus abietinus]